MDDDTTTDEISVTMQMTSLTVCRIPGLGGCILSKGISFKLKIWYPVKHVCLMDTRL